jgi:hypothetical protein
MRSNCPLRNTKWANLAGLIGFAVASGSGRTVWDTSFIVSFKRNNVRLRILAHAAPDDLIFESGSEAPLNGRIATSINTSAGFLTLLDRAGRSGAPTSPACRAPTGCSPRSCRELAGRDRDLVMGEAICEWLGWKRPT